MKATRFLSLLVIFSLASCKKGDSFLSASLPSSSVSETERKKEVIITLDYNYGGDLEKKESATFTYQEPYQLPIPEIPSSLGDAVFEGWYCKNTRVETIGSSFPFSSSVTLLAHYTHNDYSGYVNADGTVTLTSVKEKQGRAVIPSLYNGRRVTQLASGRFYGNKSVKSAVLPEGIKTIKDSCFGSCPNLTEITLPKSLLSIEAYAFYGDKKLKKVYYEGDLTSWLNLSLDYGSNPCTNLSVLYFKGAEVNHILIPESITEINDYAFSGVTSLSSVSFLGECYGIGEEAFSNCRSLESIQLPDRIQSIGENSFSFCTGLLSIDLPDPIKTIPAGAFSSCFDLTSVKIGNQAATIESSAFYRCYDLKSVSLPNSLTVIATSAFESCTSLESLLLPAALKTIDNYAFKSCGSLTCIEIPSLVDSIGCGAFEGTYSVSSRMVKPDNPVYYSSGNTILEKKNKRVIAGCKDSLLPKETLVIGQESFFGCSKLTDISLPESVTAIENYAFSNCLSLKSISIGKNVTTIGKNVFTGTSARESFVIDKDNPSYQSEGNCLLNKEKSILYYGCKSSVIPTTVEVIADEAFYYCRDRKNRIIPSSVKVRGDRVFSHCYGLTSRIIPDSVTSLGESAFDNCFNRTSFTFGNGIEVIPDNCLKDCDSLQRVILGDRVSQIGDFTFYRNYQVKERNLPSSLKEIGTGSFAVTDRKLNIGSENKSFCFKSGCLRDKKETQLYYGNREAEIESTITDILPYAFYGNTGIKEIVLPDSLKTIGEKAFRRSFVSSVVFPSTIKSIDSMAFSECDYLRSISYLGTMSEWKKVNLGDLVFSSVPAKEIICSDQAISLEEEAE